MRNKRRSEEDSGRNRTEEKTIMKTIAIYNIKGGDGKTTTAKHLAVGLAKKVSVYYLLMQMAKPIVPNLLLTRN